MALVNHAKREINVKIVYFGQQGAGKGTTLTYLHGRIRPALRSDVKMLPASGDVLQFFDFSPFDHQVLGGYRVRFHIYTLPGLVTNPAAWRMTLKGADGIVIVADGTPGREAEQAACVALLRDHLAVYGVGLADVPLVLQVNKSDLSDTEGEDCQAAAALPEVAVCRSNALTGAGVLETFSLLSRQVMERVARDILPQDVNAADYGDMDEQPLVCETEPAGESVPDAWPETVASGNFSVALAGPVTSGERELLRIPLEIRLGSQSRRVVVSVALDGQEES